MRNGIIVHTAEGAIGGALGTLFTVTGTTRVARRLPERLKPPPTRGDPAEYVISRLEELRGRPLPAGARERLAGGLRWAYGIGWGGLLGLSTARRPTRTVAEALLAGLALGAVVWAVGYVGLLPATKLTPPVHRQGGRHIASALIGHLAYGVLTSMALLALDRARHRREPPWRRAIREVARRGGAALRRFK